MFSLLLLYSLLLLISFIFLLSRLLRARPLPDIPTTPSLPLFGHSLSLIAHFARTTTVVPWIEEFPRRFGSKQLCQIMLRFHEPLLLCSDPEQIKFIYGSKDWDFAQMVVDIFKGVIPKSMLANKSGALVSYHRKAFAYAFSHAFLTLSASVFSSHFRILLQQWDARSRAGNEKEGAFIPALEGLELLGTDVMSQVMYGDSYNQLSSGKRHTMTKDFATILSTLTDGPFNVFISWVKRLNPAYRAANRRGIAYVVERVEKARQKIRGGGEIERVESMIDIIMRKEARDGEGRVMAEDELRDELSTFMFAGSDTSSSTQLWVLKFLSENPSVQERLHDDLIRALPLPDERAPTLDEITPEILPYLEAVVQECSRLAQTIPFTERQATCDTTLFGSNGETYFIPAGTQVFLLNGWATRHQGPDSESFRPERWLDEKGAYDGNRVWSISFGGGNRKCYGHKLALVFLRLFIAQLSLSHFVLPLPSHLKSTATTKVVTRKPAKNWVGLRKWAEMGRKWRRRLSQRRAEEGSTRIGLRLTNRLRK